MKFKRLTRWKDKKEVLVISSGFRASMGGVSERLPGGGIALKNAPCQYADIGSA